MESQLPNDADQAALNLLAQQGLDMRSPIDFEFAIKVADDRGGQIVVDRLKQLSLGVSYELAYDPGELEEGEEMTESNREFWPTWTVYVERRMIPDYENLIFFQKLLKEACGDFGRLDGWNAEVR